MLSTFYQCLIPCTANLMSRVNVGMYKQVKILLFTKTDFSHVEVHFHFLILDLSSHSIFPVNHFHRSSILWAKRTPPSATGSMPYDFSIFCFITGRSGHIARYSLNPLETHALVPCPEARLQSALYKKERKASACF